MRAKSIKGKSSEEIQSALQQSMTDGFKPTLAIAFISVKQDRKAICKLLDEKSIAIFGATTNGEFIDENHSKNSAAILLLDMNPDHFRVLFAEYPEKNYREVAAGIAKTTKQLFANPAFLLSGSHMETDAEQLLFGFEEVVGKQVNVFGGMAGDDYAFKQQYVFTNNKESNRGMVVLAVDEDKIMIRGKATCGWKAVGTERIVTNDHSFYCSGSVPQGSKVRFSIPPDFDVMEKVITGVQALKAAEMPEADAVVVFSCAGRILALGPLMNQEIEGIKNVWNAPMAGMFSNAELARATGGNLEMHNCTTCCVALKEK